MFLKIPFLRFAFAMIAGILTEIYVPSLFFFEWLGIIVCAIVYLAVALFAPRDTKNALKPCLGFISVLMFYVFGILVTRQQTIFNYPNHLSKQKSQVAYYTGKIISEIEEKENTFRFELNISSIKNDIIWNKATGKVLVYIYKTGYKGNLKYGDNLIVKGSPQPINAPSNPGEFNLRRFYQFHGIGHRQFVKSSDLVLITNMPDNQLIALSILMRQKADAIFRKYIHKERERKIASALILGIKGDIDDEIQQAYASTGTMHVLAVSGLHVGIIYKILQWILSFLAKIKHGNKIRAILLIVCLWFYAFVTGLCPSVLRAVAMFSFIILADALGKRSSIFNTLALSCIILLSYNPYFLMEVGFQLSFLAVGGIIYLQPMLYHIVEFKNKVADWLWSVTSVSLAAQLITFPLGLLYFHQFPNYFLLSNLIVIPAAILIMSVGLGFVALSFWEIVATWLGFVIEWSVWSLNWIIMFIENLPYSTWLGISISVFESWLIYLAILMGISIWVNKKMWNIIGFTVVLGLFSFLQIIEIYQQSHQYRLIVYHINKASAIDLIDGFEAKIIAKPEVYLNRQKMQFHVLNHRWERGISLADEHVNVKQISIGKLFVWKGKKVLIVDKSTYKTPKITVNIAIIQNNSVRNLSNFVQHVSFDTLVVDGSNNTKFVANINKQATEIGVKIHVTQEKGAFWVDE